jgi:hypothetical protein
MKTETSTRFISRQIFLYVPLNRRRECSPSSSSLCLSLSLSGSLSALGTRIVTRPKHTTLLLMLSLEGVPLLSTKYTEWMNQRKVLQLMIETQSKWKALQGRHR